MEIKNKKASFNYELLKNFEAGIVLKGSEVKSIKAGNTSINESFIFIKNNEIFIKQMFIKKYKFSNSFEKISETRERKLLLNKNEIKKIKKELELKGISLIPLKVYTNKLGKIKIEISLAKGKSLFDKRKSLKEKDIKLNIERSLNEKWFLHRRRSW